MLDQTSNNYVQSFFIVPAYILDLPGMTLGYLRVYEAIFQFWNHNKTCFLSEKALCERSGLGRSQIYAALSYFEKHNELKRVQKKYKRYIVRPEKLIETDCIDIKQVSGSSGDSINIKHPSGRADVDVRPSGRETSGRADYNNKKLNKENKKTTNCESSSFSEKLTPEKEFLLLQIPSDTRTPQEFLEECFHHMKNNSDKSFNSNQQHHGLLKILKQCKDSNSIFKSKKVIEEIKKIETAEERNERFRIEREEQRKKIYG